MVNVVKGGYSYYGAPIGILLLDTRYPRVPGDVGNATTFNFPVVYKIIKGAYGKKVVETPFEDPKLLESFVKGAQELEREGVKAITTDCGFLALFQKELSSAVSIPIFTSSLMQVPLVYGMLRKDKKVGVITFQKRSLTKKHLEAVGIEFTPIVIYGMDECSEWHHCLPSSPSKPIEFDVNKMESEVVEVAKTMIRENPDIGAIVLECVNMPPYAYAVQKATGLPVFDITTLIKYVYSGLVRRPFNGWL